MDFAGWHQEPDPAPTPSSAKGPTNSPLSAPAPPPPPAAVAEPLTESDLEFFGRLAKTVRAWDAGPTLAPELQHRRLRGLLALLYVELAQYLVRRQLPYAQRTLVVPVEDAHLTLRDAEMLVQEVVYIAENQAYLVKHKILTLAVLFQEYFSAGEVTDDGVA